jgi:hypothetical protein
MDLPSIVRGSLSLESLIFVSDFTRIPHSFSFVFGTFDKVIKVIPFGHLDDFG